MKYEFVSCCQCGKEFKRTNHRHLYCSGACRVSAHRDRHGYEQPIFQYPVIRAVEQLQEVDVQNLYRIKLYAMRYLNDLQEKGKTIPPIDIEMQLFNDFIKLSMVGDTDDAIIKLINIVEPFTEVINIIQKIQENKTAQQLDVISEN